MEPVTRLCFKGEDGFEAQLEDVDQVSDSDFDLVLVRLSGPDLETSSPVEINPFTKIFLFLFSA